MFIIVCVWGMNSIISLLITILFHADLCMYSYAKQNFVNDKDFDIEIMRNVF